MIDNNIIGRNTLLDFDFSPNRVGGKVDTGAETNSIHSTESFVKGGILYCSLLDNTELIPFKDYIVKTVKSSNGLKGKRYCIELKFKLNGNDYVSEFTLNDRGNMKYPVLLGKNFLKDNNYMVDVSKSLTESIVTKTVKKILKEDAEDKLYKKIASIVKPPYVTDMDTMGLTNKEILKVLEVIFGMELKIYGIDTGGDVFVHPKMGGQWIYFEEFDGRGWEVVERNEQDSAIKKYGFDGDDYYDEEVKPIDLSNVRL
jgi:hypothetical protein